MRVQSIFTFFGMLSVLTSLSGGLVGVGCSGKGIDDSDPTTLFKDAEDDIKNDRYQSALEKFKIVKNKFPYSKYSAEAQLKIGDVEYLQESFAEAAASYETFVELHPKHEKVGYAQLRIAQSYFNDSPSLVARDLTSMQKAVDAFTSFLKTHPEGAESDQAKKDVGVAKNRLAAKELYIGNFYFKDREYLAAKGRYEGLIDQYPEADCLAEAKEKLAKAELKLKELNQP